LNSFAKCMNGRSPATSTGSRREGRSNNSSRPREPYGTLNTCGHGQSRGAHPVAYAQGFYGMETTDDLKTRRHGQSRGAHPVAYAQGFYGMETTDKLKTCRHGGQRASRATRGRQPGFPCLTDRIARLYTIHRVAYYFTVVFLPRYFTCRSSASKATPHGKSESAGSARFLR
jgi:hypothetical protein